MRRTLPLPALAAVALLLAGCGAPATTDTTSPTTTAPPPQPAPALALASCQGYHTFYASPTEGFQQFVPDNFTLDASEAGTLQIPVFAFDCANGTAEMWALLPVVPPAEWQNASYAVDAVVLQGFTTNATFRAAYLAWGFDPSVVLQATGVERESLGAGVANDDRIALSDGSRRYEVRATTQPGSGAGTFAAEAYRFWATNGTRAVGWLEVQESAANDLGAGTAAFQSQGDPGAPPVTVGIAHRVGGAGLRMEWHALT